MPYSQLGALIRAGRIRADVVLLQVSPPNARGEYSLGLGADYLVPALEVCRAIVAEVNDQVPWTWSERLLREEDFDLSVHTSRAPLQAPYRPGELEAAIARAAASLVPDGATVEFGIGAQGPEVRAKGTQKAINYWALANLVNVNNAGMPKSLWDITLNCRHVFHANFEIPDVQRKYGNLTLTYAAQIHAAVVEVDRETFQPKILAYACVDDCGKAVNPRIVEGQVHGASAHGIGAALLENCAYDSDGNLLTATFSDYTPITAMNMPELLYAHMESPSPFTLNGAKGMGEGGAAPVHTICAALQDALYPSGVIIDDSHNTGDSLFHALRKAESGGYAAMVRVEHRTASR